MHVGLVVDGPLDRMSGGYRYDRHLVGAFEERGDDVDVISLSEVSRFDESIRSRLDRPFDVLLQDELCHATLVEHNRQLERPATVVAIVHNLRSDDPTVPDRSRVREVERSYLESVDAAVCTSEDTRDRTTVLAAIPTTVAPPAGRHEGPAVAPSTVEGRASDDPLRIAFVGNLVPRKGVCTLLEGLAKVDRAWQLTVVGSHEADPAYATRARDRAEALEITDRVEFTGRVPDDALETVYERSHVLAVPSRQEGFGMVYLEGMEYGTVPIASRVGGASEFVADGENGFLVEPEDPARLADIVAEVDDDRELLATLGVTALETTAAHPSWDETVTTVRSFLRDGLERGFETQRAEDGGAET